MRGAREAQGGCGKLSRAEGDIFALMFYLVSVLRLQYLIFYLFSVLGLEYLFCILHIKSKCKRNVNMFSSMN